MDDEDKRIFVWESSWENTEPRGGNLKIKRGHERKTSQTAIQNYWKNTQNKWIQNSPTVIQKVSTIKQLLKGTSDKT